MKTIKYLFLGVLLISCKGKDKPFAPKGANVRREIKSIAFKPYPLNNDYTVIDTGAYENDGPMSGGRYAIIKRNRRNIDTIELDYGMKALSGKAYFYQKLSYEPDTDLKESKGNLTLTEGNYILISDTGKRAFNSLCKNFDDAFSSPNVINRKIYYWQLDKSDSLGNLKVSAAEFNPSTKEIKSYFLLNDDPQTDDTNYFSMPYLKGGQIIFTIDEKRTWKFAADFKPL